ncbi:HU family DNA-binding protein [Candidatus Pelagibacter sp.]|uniref:HU family DNA-binding protein n=1 Tax=Candidatus Pelagibacter sp. TaxID=2024849 RepID=UPI003F85C6D7
MKKLAIVKSELIKELKKSYPNFLSRDLNKIIEIILKEIKDALNRGEGVELRNFGTFRTNIQKASIRRNPKTGEKVSVSKKKTIKWKMSKDLFKKLNNEKE